MREALVSSAGALVLVAACHARAPSLEEAAFAAQQRMPTYDGTTRCGPPAPPAVSPPVPMREPAFGFTAPQGDVAGESSWEINHRVMADRDALRLCYQRELARDATLGGRVNVAFTIRRDGHVAGIVVTGFHPDLDACVCRTFAAMVFPPGDGDSHVRYPLLYGQ